MKLFLYVDKTDVTNIYLNHIFELLVQIIDDLVVFSQEIYFEVIGISYYFICTMKWAPNSNVFILSMSVDIKADVKSICLESSFWTHITNYYKLS
jgi:type III secretory pathway component EscT